MTQIQMWIPVQTEADAEIIMAQSPKKPIEFPPELNEILAKKAAPILAMQELIKGNRKKSVNAITFNFLSQSIYNFCDIISILVNKPSAPIKLGSSPNYHMASYRTAGGKVEPLSKEQGAKIFLLRRAARNARQATLEANRRFDVPGAPRDLKISAFERLKSACGYLAQAYKY